jgi:transcription termination factor Rho
MTESATENSNHETASPRPPEKKPTRKRALKAASAPVTADSGSITPPLSPVLTVVKAPRKSSRTAKPAASEGKSPSQEEVPSAVKPVRRRTSAKSLAGDVEKQPLLPLPEPSGPPPPTPSPQPKAQRDSLQHFTEENHPKPSTEETWSPSQVPARPVGPQSESYRRPYPVYVPLHVAKQMEQEGKTAPIGITANDQRAADTRPVSVLPQPTASAPTTAQAATSAAQDSVASPRLENRQHDHRHDNRPENRRDRNDRKDRHDRHQGGRRGGRPERGGRGVRQDDLDRAPIETAHDLPPPREDELFAGEGIIEISGKGFGFLRDARRGFTQSPADIFVSPEMVRRFNLRDGQWVKGDVRKGGRGQQMHKILTVNDEDPEKSRLCPTFEELTVINPQEPLRMETKPERYTTRVIDLVTPIGKGQRGLIVAPPRTGKTTLLQHIADAMVLNHPDVKLIILLVDERPEEVTEIKHTVPSAEIMASSNDMDVRSHTRIAELAIERAKRLVESGRDVFILLDSITRLGRAFNNATTGGRTMSGGIDARALEIPRKLFAAARNTEEAGSLTIIATALIETGSRMDELIFQEFKGTGNMELVLDRKISEQRIYPAADIFQSGTRREELLVPADALQKIHLIRRGLAGCRPMDAIDRLLFYLKKFPTNEQMLREIRG